MRDGSAKRSSSISVGIVLVMLACSANGPTVRPKQPDAAALAVRSEGGCHVGKEAVFIDPEGPKALVLDADESYLALRYRPTGECGGRKEIEYFVSFGGGAVKLEGVGPATRSSDGTGVAWRLTSPGSIRFVSAVAAVSPVADAGPPPTDVRSSRDARDLPTITDVDEATEARRVSLLFVLNEDVSHQCSLRLRWKESTGQYESCSSSDGDGCGGGGDDDDDD